jgi:hypothetical protein
MPFTPQYADPVTSSADIGYSSAFQLGSPANFESGPVNIPNSTITLPSAGVWLVEALINIQASNHSTYFTWSLSTTSGHLDDSRTISSYVAYSSASPPSIYPISRMTSVFSVTESTIVYMVGEFEGSEANINSKSYMKYTRLA